MTHPQCEIAFLSHPLDIDAITQEPNMLLSYRNLSSSSSIPTVAMNKLLKASLARFSSRKCCEVGYRPLSLINGPVTSQKRSLQITSTKSRPLRNACIFMHGYESPPQMSRWNNQRQSKLCMLYFNDTWRTAHTLLSYHIFLRHEKKLWIAISHVF